MLALQKMRSRNDQRIRPKARGRSRSAAILLIAVGLLTMRVADVGRAASIERLDDGRIAIAMLGERLTLREEDVKAVYNFFYQSLSCDGKIVYKLESWLTDPKLAACLNAGIPNGHGDNRIASIKLVRSSP